MTRLRMFFAVACVLIVLIGGFHQLQSVQLGTGRLEARETQSALSTEGHAIVVSENKKELSPQRSNVVATKALSLPQPVNAQFERARTCHEAITNKAAWQLQKRICSQSIDATFLENCSANTADIDMKIQSADRVLAQCSPVPAEIQEDFYRSTIQAAKSGDSAAQVCYLQSEFDLKRPFTNQEAAYYHSVAADYVNGGLARGDWRLVALLSTRYRDPAHRATLRSELAGGDAYTLYQMNRLLAHGADGPYKTLLDTIADDERVSLSEDQITRAEAWANSLYESNFSTSPRLEDAPTVCESHT